MNLALPKAGRDVLGFGLRALRRLGMRPTELNEYLSLSAASVKRYVVLRGGEPEASLAGRRLRREQEEALILYWCQVIAQWKPLSPVGPGRRLLDAFCPACLHVQAAKARASVHVPAAALRTLEDALLIGATCCAAGVRPCVQGPARLAALVHLLKVHPAAAAASLARMETSVEGSAEPVIHPDRLWVRTCLSCRIPSVTDAREHAHFCRRHVPRSA